MLVSSVAIGQPFIQSLSTIYNLIRHRRDNQPPGFPTYQFQTYQYAQFPFSSGRQSKRF
jgi:hypothetical protein